MKKISLFFISAVLFSLFSVPVFTVPASAQGLLPSTELPDFICEALMNNSFLDIAKAVGDGKEYKFKYYDDNDVAQDTSVNNMDDVLGCALRTGQFKLSMLPYMVLYGIKFFSGLAGVLSVLFIVIGGYHFIIGSLTEEKEKGKKTIMYALIGFALSILAYTIVNLVQIAVSS